MKISEALRAIISNPDDLSTLPQLVEKIEALENGELEYQERIQKLQDINKSYLAQIPIKSEFDNEDEPPEEEPTLEDAKDYLLEALKGDK